MKTSTTTAVVTENIDDIINNQHQTAISMFRQKHKKKQKSSTKSIKTAMQIDKINLDSH